MVKQAISSLIKQSVILTSFYGQTYSEPQEYSEYIKDKIINQYFYFTLFSLLLTTIVLILNSSKSKLLRDLHLFLLPNIIVYEILVVLIYWPLFFINKNLILSKVRLKPGNYLLLVDLCQHLFPVFGLGICFFEENIEIDIKNHIFSVITFFVYGSMIYINFHKLGYFPYTFMYKMGFNAVFFIFLPIVFVISTFLIFFVVWLNGRIKNRKKA